MAAADYCLCFRCGAKAFYDSNVESEAYLNAFQWPNHPDHPQIGIKVLCVQCNKTHAVVIVERQAANDRCRHCGAETVVIGDLCHVCRDTTAETEP
jgi:hypothetical protein